MVIETDPACTPHAMLALSTWARIASSSPEPSPRSALTYTSSFVTRVAVQQLDRVRQHREDGLERLARPPGAPRDVEDQRLPTHSCRPARDPGHGRRLRSRAPH